MVSIQDIFKSQIFKLGSQPILKGSERKVCKVRIKPSMHHFCQIHPLLLFPFLALPTSLPVPPTTIPAANSAGHVFITSRCTQPPVTALAASLCLPALSVSTTHDACCYHAGSWHFQKSNMCPTSRGWQRGTVCKPSFILEILHFCSLGMAVRKLN